MTRRNRPPQTKLQAELEADARQYLDRGLSTVPLNDKKPTVMWKPFQTRRPTDPELRHWYRFGDVTGVAVITCEASGSLAIRDFDTEAGYEEWKEKYPTAARTCPTSRTKRGYHVWCNSDLQRTVKLDDGEYRGFGISVSPRSLHVKSGIRYGWEIPLPKGELPFVEHEVFLGSQTAAPQAPCDTEIYTSHSLSISVPLCISSVALPNEVIQKTQPTGPRERNARLLDLARGLKFNCGMANAPFDQLKPFVKQWFALAADKVETKDIDITFCDFKHAFDRATVPLGLSVVDVAASKIDPLDLCGVALRYEGQAMRQLVSLCFELSKVNADAGKFFLSCHDASPRLKVTPMQVWRLLNALREDGVIELLGKGNQHRASRYRWVARDEGEG